MRYKLNVFGGLKPCIEEPGFAQGSGALYRGTTAGVGPPYEQNDIHIRLKTLPSHNFVDGHEKMDV